jgi:hypothetical protein
MILETGDLESVPILLTKALADDGEEWWIDLHTHGGEVRGGYLQEADWHEVRIQDESGDEPFGETHSWDEIAKVVIP